MSTSPTELATEAGRRRAWGWVAALRAGGTTPWAEWRGDGDRSGPYLPGAQQLELLRRLNRAGPPSPALVERVLLASAPGRGSPDLELVGASAESPFGPRPVDPADLPDAELLRVATNLIAEDLVAAGVPAPEVPGRPRPWRRPYRLVGHSWFAETLRPELARRGHPPGPRRRRSPVVLVLGADLATLLVDAWTARSFDDGGAAPWPDWLRGVVAGDRLPPRADLLAPVRAWTERVGRRRVEVVLDPARLPALIGTRRPLPPRVVPSADAVDLARRTAAPLGVLTLPEHRAELLRGVLLPRLVDDAGPPLAVPAEHHDWVHDRAVRVRDDLLTAGYAGDPDALLPPRDPSDRSGPTDAGVLSLALRTLLDTGQEVR